jgi:hypothetical protein
MIHFAFSMKQQLNCAINQILYLEAWQCGWSVVANSLCRIVWRQRVAMITPTSTQHCQRDHLMLQTDTQVSCLHVVWASLTNSLFISSSGKLTAPTHLDIIHSFLFFYFFYFFIFFYFFFYFFFNFFLLFYYYLLLFIIIIFLHYSAGSLTLTLTLTLPSPP